MGEMVGGSITFQPADEEMVEVDAAGWYIVTVRPQWLDNGCEGRIRLGRGRF